MFRFTSRFLPVLTPVPGCNRAVFVDFRCSASSLKASLSLVKLSEVAEVAELILKPHFKPSLAPEEYVLDEQHHLPDLIPQEELEVDRIVHAAAHSSPHQEEALAG